MIQIAPSALMYAFKKAMEGRDEQYRLIRDEIGGYPHQIMAEAIRLGMDELETRALIIREYGGSR